MSPSREPNSVSNSSTSIEFTSLFMLAVVSSRTGKLPEIISSEGLCWSAVLLHCALPENFHMARSAPTMTMTTITMRDFFIFVYKLLIFQYIVDARYSRECCRGTLHRHMCSL